MRSTRKSFRRSKRTSRRYPYMRVPAYNRAQKAELKCFDFHVPSSTALVTVGNVVGAYSLATGMSVVNVPSTGALPYNQVGNKIDCQSLAVEAELLQPQTDVSSSTVRLIVVYDRQPNGAYPLITDLLYDNATAVTFNSAISISGRDRFKMLRDCQIVLDPASCLAKHYETYIKLGSLASSYAFSPNVDNITTITSGAIYLIMFYVQHVGTTAPKFDSVHTRLRYYDS